MTKNGLSLFFCLSTFLAPALVLGQSVILKPGSQVIIDFGPTTVICAEPDQPAFTRYCRCGQEGFANQFVLRIVLDKDGNSDELGSYVSESNCLKVLHYNPACGK